jgi:hypothetical protein
MTRIYSTVARSIVTGQSDLHFSGLKIFDKAAFQRSAETDAALDRLWFAKNQHLFTRERIASEDERLAFGLGAGAMIRVSRGADGSQKRKPLSGPTQKRRCRKK